MGWSICRCPSWRVGSRRSFGRRPRWCPCWCLCRRVGRCFGRRLRRRYRLGWRHSAGRTGAPIHRITRLARVGTLHRVTSLADSTLASIRRGADIVVRIAGRPIGFEAIRRTVVARASAVLGQVALTGGRPANDTTRYLDVRRAAYTGARAVLRNVTHAASSATQRTVRLVGGRGTGVVNAIAIYVGIAHIDCHVAHARALAVRRTGATVTSAVLRQVTHSLGVTAQRSSCTEHTR